MINENQENKGFRFYSVLKNEDAAPYSDSRLLVAADGLGGAGSTVHVIDREKYDDFAAELYEAAYGDLNVDEDEEFKNWLVNVWLKDMADDKDDTSALWASRIVIARFVYALTRSKSAKEGTLDISDKKTQQKLFAFVGRGLERVADRFDLQSGKYSNQLLLPTTLAAIQYTEEENDVIAESLWAGDSRCYALTPNGLFSLSQDDEDGSGAINNLFYLGDEDAVRQEFNYKKFKIPKPCVLMTVSDGIFDPFDAYSHFGVECVLLNHIKNCSGFDELAESLKVNFDRIHADDATMAFTMFGFEDYNDLQEKLSQRTDKMLAMWEKFAEMKSRVDVSDDEDEVAGYVRNRTSDKFPGVITELLNSLQGDGETDFAVTETLKEIVGKKCEKEETPSSSVEAIEETTAPKAESAYTGASEEKKPSEKEAEKIDEDAENVRIMKALEKLCYGYMKTYPQEVAWLEGERRCSAVFSDKKPLSLITTIKAKAVYYCKKKKECELYAKECDLYAEEFKKLKEELITLERAVFSGVEGIIDEYRSRFDALRGVAEKGAPEWREAYNYLAYNWGRIELLLTKKEIPELESPLKKLIYTRKVSIYNTPENRALVEEFNKREQLLIARIDEYKKLRRAYADEKRKCDGYYNMLALKEKARDKEFQDYELNVKSLFELLCKNPKAAEGYFQDEIAQRFRLKFGMGEDPKAAFEDSAYEPKHAPVVEEKKEEKPDPMAAALAKKETLVAEIVAALAENYDETSVIDRFYNASRLYAFREFYRMRSNPDDSIQKFELELEALMAAYEALWGDKE